MSGIDKWNKIQASRMNERRNNVLKLFNDGATVEELAHTFGVRKGLISGDLKAMGVKDPFRRSPSQEQIEEVALMYQSGESQLGIARILNITRPRVRQCLELSNTPIRSFGETMQIVNSRLGAEARMQMTEAARTSRRGMKDTWASKVQRAKTRELRQLGVSELENILAEQLEDRGLKFRQQGAVGPYNVDFLIDDSIAVEIYGGPWHALGRHAARSQERFEYLLNRQHLAVLIVWASGTISGDAADQVVSFVELTRRDPSTRGKYRVIGRDDQVFVSLSTDLDNITIVPPTI